MRAPVLIIGFNRPEFVKRRLEELSNSMRLPDFVIVSIDGPRNVSEQKSFSEYRDFLNSNNYPFRMQLILREKNLGCSDHIITAVTEVLQKYDEIVVLEDDVRIGENTFEVLSDGLEYIQDKSNFGTVGAFSPFHSLPNWVPKKNLWRGSQYFSAWGWATNRNFWNSFVRVNEIEDLDAFLSNSPSWQCFSARKRKIWGTRFRRGVWDFNVQMILFKESKLNLLPYFRVIENEGFKDFRSTHTKHGRPWTLFGEGISDLKPKFPKELNSNFFVNSVWQFFDANLWAADGYFSTRARQSGIRTLARKTFQRFW